MDPISAIGSVVAIGSKLIDKLFPDPTEKAKAQLELLRLQQSGELEDAKITLSAIIAEANSSDPWTSRARPSFLYVVYLLLLFSLPMGILSVFSPESAHAISSGMKEWMASIPQDIIELFKWVMLGYIGGRSVEKIKGATK